MRKTVSPVLTFVASAAGKDACDGVVPVAWESRPTQVSAEPMQCSTQVQSEVLQFCLPSAYGAGHRAEPNRGPLGTSRPLCGVRKG
jgi:hypothetical protein